MPPEEKSKSEPKFHLNLKRWLPSKMTVLLILTPILVLYLGFLGFINWAMHQPPETFGRIMMHMPGPAYLVIPFETLWSRARAGTVEPGQLAPEFSLAKLQDGHATPDDRVQLAALRASKSGGQPVVLVFGSYT